MTKVDSYITRLQRWWSASGCIVCRDETPTALCAACRQSLPWVSSACPRCAAPLPTELSGVNCGECQSRPPAFDQTVAALEYVAPVDRLIHGLKYAGQLSNASVLADLLTDRLTATGAMMPECIIPMPLHRSRLHHRGYNQALEIARPLACRLGIRIDSHIARRTRDTPPQTELDRAARRRNVRGAFAVSSAFRYEHVAILDDVMTSGETASALAKVLHGAGAVKISVWVCARVTHGPNNKPPRQKTT